jgi:hypothetical protein
VFEPPSLEHGKPWSPTADAQTEAGWHEYVSGSSHAWCLFWEAQLGTAVYGGPCQPASATSPATGTSFRVSYFHDSGNFKYSVNFGSGWLDIPVPGSPNGFDASIIGMTHGWPRGEEGRRGGTGSGATDDQSSLQYKANAYSDWKDWTENDTRGGNQNGVTGYHHCSITNTHYTFIITSISCP